jgi:hypothetical protein
VAVDDSHDTVELERALERIVQPEARRHRARVGHPRRLDQNVVEAFHLHKLLHALDEVIAHCAAHAAVGELHPLGELLAVGTTHGRLLETDRRAHLVLHHRYLEAVRLGEHMSEQRGLACAEEASDDSHGHRRRHVLV